MTRDYIENRDDEVVSNKAQYCSVVRTGIGGTVLCLGGEVDASKFIPLYFYSPIKKLTSNLPPARTVWDSKPAERGAATNWVELKTSAEIRDERGMHNFERKLMRFWIQSHLLGVPKIVVGFRSPAGVLTKLEEIQTATIPQTAAQRGVRSWDAAVCVNFAAAFLAWLRDTVNDEGVWRIRRRPRAHAIEVFKVEEVGHGDVLTDEFINWRIKLGLKESAAAAETAAET